jgi:hypothetical protein
MIEGQIMLAKNRKKVGSWINLSLYTSRFKPQYDGWAGEGKKVPMESEWTPVSKKGKHKSRRNISKHSACSNISRGKLGPPEGQRERHSRWDGLRDDSASGAGGCSVRSYPGGGGGRRNGGIVGIRNSGNGGGGISSEKHGMRAAWIRRERSTWKSILQKVRCLPVSSPESKLRAMGSMMTSCAPMPSEEHLSDPLLAKMILGLESALEALDGLSMPNPIISSADKGLMVAAVVRLADQCSFLLHGGGRRGHHFASLASRVCRFIVRACAQRTFLPAANAASSTSTSATMESDGDSRGKCAPFASPKGTSAMAENGETSSAKNDSRTSFTGKSKGSAASRLAMRHRAITTTLDPGKDSELGSIVAGTAARAVGNAALRYGPAKNDPVAVAVLERCGAGGEESTFTAAGEQSSGLDRGTAIPVVSVSSSSADAYSCAAGECMLADPGDLQLVSKWLVSFLRWSLARSGNVASTNDSPATSEMSKSAGANDYALLALGGLLGGQSPNGMIALNHGGRLASSNPVLLEEITTTMLSVGEKTLQGLTPSDSTADSTTDMRGLSQQVVSILTVLDVLSNLALSRSRNGGGGGVGDSSRNYGGLSVVEGVCARSDVKRGAMGGEIRGLMSAVGQDTREPATQLALRNCRIAAWSFAGKVFDGYWRLYKGNLHSNTAEVLSTNEAEPSNVSKSHMASPTTVSSSLLLCAALRSLQLLVATNCVTTGRSIGTFAAGEGGRASAVAAPFTVHRTDSTHASTSPRRSVQLIIDRTDIARLLVGVHHLLQPIPLHHKTGGNISDAGSFISSSVPWASRMTSLAGVHPNASRDAPNVHSQVYLPPNRSASVHLSSSALLDSSALLERWSEASNCKEDREYLPRQHSAVPFLSSPLLAASSPHACRLRAPHTALQLYALNLLASLASVYPKLMHEHWNLFLPVRSDLTRLTRALGANKFNGLVGVIKQQQMRRETQQQRGQRQTKAAASTATATAAIMSPISAAADSTAARSTASAVGRDIESSGNNSDAAATHVLAVVAAQEATMPRSDAPRSAPLPTLMLAQFEPIPAVRAAAANTAAALIANAPLRLWLVGNSAVRRVAAFSTMTANSVGLKSDHVGDIGIVGARGEGTYFSPVCVYIRLCDGEYAPCIINI